MSATSLVDVPSGSALQGTDENLNVPGITAYNRMSQRDKTHRGGSYAELSKISIRVSAR